MSCLNKSVAYSLFEAEKKKCNEVKFSRSTSVIEGERGGSGKVIMRQIHMFSLRLILVL